MCILYINICCKSEEGPDRVRTELCNNGCTMYYTYYCSMHYTTVYNRTLLYGCNSLTVGVGGRGKYLFISLTKSNASSGVCITYVFTAQIYDSAFHLIHLI
jgi:hypothetical protein